MAFRASPISSRRSPLVAAPPDRAHHRFRSGTESTLMTDDELVDLLKTDRDAWSRWRQENLLLRPDLVGACEMPQPRGGRSSYAGPAVVTFRPLTMRLAARSPRHPFGPPFCAQSLTGRRSPFVGSFPLFRANARHARTQGRQRGFGRQGALTPPA